MALSNIWIVAEPSNGSFATTSLDSEEIHKLAPLNTAALLQGIPGVTVASTGGEQGNNLFVRGFPSSGDAPYVTFQLAGSAVFDPPTVGWFGNADVIRIDEMVDHVEAVRGGPAQVLSNGQVGLTVNVLPKTGTDVYHGVGSIGRSRFDSHPPSQRAKIRTNATFRILSPSSRPIEAE